MAESRMQVNGKSVKTWEVALEDFKGGMSLEDIAVKYNRKLVSVKQWNRTVWKQALENEGKPKKKKKKELAFEDYNAGMSNSELAEKYKVSVRTVENWKSEWKKLKCGVRYGKLVKVPGTKDEFTDGMARFRAKYFPEEINEIIGLMPTDSLDLLWSNIQILYAQIVRGQRLLYVRDQNDYTERVISTSEGKGGKTIVRSFQESWDKHANFLANQARAMATLNNMISNYERILESRSESATEMQKLQVEKLKLEVQALQNTNVEASQDDGFTQALNEAAEKLWEE